MATQHEVDVARTLYCAHVVVVVEFPSQVGNTYHEVAFFVTFEEGGHIECRLHRVEEFHAGAVFDVHQSVESRTKAEYAYLHSVAVDDDPWLDKPFDHGALEVVVAAHDGEVGHAEEACHVVESEVEFMVADGHGKDENQMCSNYFENLNKL